MVWCYLETLQVAWVDGERVLVTRLGLAPLRPRLVDGALQVEDQVGQREHLHGETTIFMV